MTSCPIPLERNAGHRRSFVVCIVAGILLATHCPVWGQAKWTISEGSHAVNRVQSLAHEGSDLQYRYNFVDSVALIKYTNAKSEPSLMSVDLRTLRVGARVKYPSQWDWNTTVVGAKYACCIVGKELVLMDAPKCTVIAQVELAQVGDIAILFDKVVWVRPDEWYELPSLKKIDNFPGADPLAFERAKWLGDLAAPAVVSSKACYIHGVGFDRDFRPQPNFIGHFTNQDYFQPTYSIDTRLTATNSTAKQTELRLNLELRQLGIRDQSKGNQFSATASFKGSVRQQELSFYPFSQGKVAFAGDLIVAVYVKETYTRGLLASKAIYQPPLLDFNGQPFKGRIADVNGAELMDPPDLRGKTWIVQTELSPDKNSFFARLEPKSTAMNLQNLDVMSDIVDRIVIESKLDYEAEWKNIVQAYFKNNQYWLEPYAKSINSEFEGVPIEIAKDFTDEQGSFVLDFPKNRLAEVFAVLQKKKSAKGIVQSQPVPLATKLNHFASRQKTFKFPEIAPLPDLPPVEPYDYKLETVKAEWDFRSSLAIAMFPMAIIVRLAMLMFAIVTANRYHGEGDPLEVTHRFWGYLLATTAWVGLELGVIDFVVWTTDDFVRDDMAFILLRLGFNLVLAFSILLIVMKVMVAGTFGEVFPVAFFLFLVLTVRTAIAVARLIAAGVPVPY